MADEILAPGCLYRLTFPNGKAYIGITKRTAEIRFSQHAKSAKQKSTNCAVHHAILKFGRDSVAIETLARGGLAFLLAEEVRAIVEFGTMAPSGYNLTAGGEGVCGFGEDVRKRMGAANKGKRMTPETKAKISSARLGRFSPSAETREKLSKASSGRKLSEDHKQKIGAAHKGRVVSTETREKLRIAKLGKKPSAENMAKLKAVNRTRVRTEEERAKLSAALKGKPKSKEHIENMRIANTGKKLSAESIAKRTATQAANRLAKSLAA